MQITITSDTGRVFPLEVGNDLTIRDLQALVELEMSIPQSELLMVHNMAPMIEAMKTVGQYGVEEGDIIMASRVEGGVTLSDPEPLQQPSHVRSDGRERDGRKVREKERESEEGGEGNNEES